MNERILKLINTEDYERIKNLNILIVGIGGVGGFALEGLVRTGILNITIIDNDIIESSNLNRQIITTNSNIGEDKVTAAKLRAEDINPNVKINALNIFLDEGNIDEINIDKYNYVIDACDSIRTKVLLMNNCQMNNIKLITCLGTANKIDQTKLCITTLDKTYNDPLARLLRQMAKKEKLNLKQKVVFSNELPIQKEGLGTLMMVPMAAGGLCVYYLINDIIKRKII